ncbi:hypothetical protein MHYP_G00089890 [Metynnis hypsauchen]
MCGFKVHGWFYFIIIKVLCTAWFPELLKELKQPHSLKHVPLQSGLTTVFYGRGRKIAVSQNAPVPCSSSSNQHLHNGTH